MTGKVSNFGFFALMITMQCRAMCGSVLQIHPGDSFKAAVEKLRPGDTLIVHEGTYPETGRVSITVRGSVSAPVMVKGAEGETRPLITRQPPASIENTIHIEGASHLTLKGLEVRSNGGDGIRLLKNPSYVTLENLVIHDVDVGINFRSDMHHITVRRTHIYNTGALGRTGEGMYVGCHHSECVVRNCLFENNWIHDTLQASQGDGIEIKRGSHSNVIRDNTIYNTRYPCILLVGTDGEERNLVEGNVMWNCEDSGIQATADVIIRNNIIFGGPGIGFSSRGFEDISPSNLEFVHNTVVGGSPCLEVSDWGQRIGLVLANNAIYCDIGDMSVGGMADVTVTGNVFYPASLRLPKNGYITGNAPALDLLDINERNVYPSPNSKLIAAGDPLYAVDLDFNGIPRTGVPDAGAYSYIGNSNLGWKIRPGFKDNSSNSQDSRKSLGPNDD